MRYKSRTVGGFVELRGFSRAVVLMVALAMPFIARADELVPAELQAKILLRALAYDRSLPAQGGPLAFAVVFQPGDKASEAQRAELVKALQGARRTVKGREVRVVELAAGRDLPKQLEAASVAAAYVCTGAEALLADVRKVAKDKRIRTAGASRAAIEQVALVVAMDGGYPKLLVNMPLVREEGVDFEFELLKVAQVVHP